MCIAQTAGKYLRDCKKQVLVENPDCTIVEEINCKTRIRTYLKKGHESRMCVEDGNVYFRNEDRYELLGYLRTPSIMSWSYDPKRDIECILGIDNDYVYSYVDHSQKSACTIRRRIIASGIFQDENVIDHYFVVSDEFEEVPEKDYYASKFGEIVGSGYHSYCKIGSRLFRVGSKIGSGRDRICVGLVQALLIERLQA